MPLPDAGGEPGRKAFKGLGPKGVRIRMMEPGEAPALHAIAAAAGGGPAGLDAFVPYLLRREVFVAVEKAEGEPVGLAAAHAGTELYWLSCLAVAPRMRRRGVGAGLLAAVVRRAGWFFHRAIVLAEPQDPAFFARRGFLQASAKDGPPILAGHLRDEAEETGRAAAPSVLVRWL